MSKLSKFFASLASACNEQAQETLAKVTQETPAEQAKKTQWSANNLSRSAGVNSASTSHSEELQALALLVENANVARMFKECKIDAKAIAGLAKYAKAKVNATFASVAANVAPDWTKNDENAFAFFELLKKHGSKSVTFQQIQRFLDHKTLTQAGYIANLWKALNVATIRGKANDRTLHANVDSLLYRRIASLYGLIESEAQDATQEQAQDAQESDSSASDALEVSE